MMPFIVLLCANVVTVEVGGGMAQSTERYGSTQTAPLASVAAALQGSIWSAGLRGLFLLGSPGYASGADPTPHNGGLSAWGVLAEGGLHTAGNFQLGVRVGAGIGRLVLVQCDCSENQPLEGEVAPTFAASIGASGILGQFRLGIELGGMLFTGVSHVSGSPGSPGATTPPGESGLTHTSTHLIATLGWTFR